MTLTRPELERMSAEGRVCTDVALASSIAAGRRYLLDPANAGDSIFDDLDDLDDPEAILAELGLVAVDEAAEAHSGGPAAWGRSRGWSARRVGAIEGASSEAGGLVSADPRPALASHACLTSEVD